MYEIQKKIKRNIVVKKGFSLLEMVIIVAIVSIMTSVMLVVTFGERDSKEVSAAGRELTAALRETQNNSLTGKQQGAGLPCAFRFSTNFGDIDNPGDVYRVEGSYRALDGLCPDDLAPGSYTDPGSGRLFLEKDLSEDHIEIYAFTSNEGDVEPGLDHESPFIVFLVPYGKYLDAEWDPPVGDNVSIGTEFVLKKGKEIYHICMHSTGLIEELGFLPTPDGVDEGAVFLSCSF